MRRREGGRVREGGREGRRKEGKRGWKEGGKGRIESGREGEKGVGGNSVLMTLFDHLLPALPKSIILLDFSAI